MQIGAGLIRFADISDLARNDHVFEPSGEHAAYSEIYDVYQDLHKRLAPVYKRLNRPGPA